VHRRSLAAAVVLAALTLAVAVACKPEAEPARSRSETVAGAHVLDLASAHPDGAAALVVGLHGLGGSAERFARVWEGVEAPYEVALVEGFLPHDGGAAWFEWPPGASDDELAALVAAAEAKLWPVITTLAHGRKVIVTGFSQGAVMTFALAAKHPAEIAYAFPIAGRLPAKLAPTARGAPIHALHGTADPVVEIELARAAIGAFAAAGGAADLREFPGVAHTISPDMRAELLASIAAVH
jgi:phospholipase/carboxylesterase